jgi:hypothetical protein
MTTYAPRKHPLDAPGHAGFTIGGSPDIATQAIGIDQARSLLAEIVRDSYGDLLATPQLRVQPSLRERGYDGWYASDDATITIAPEVLADVVATVEVLAHEAAHHGSRMIDGVGGHGEVFQRHHRATSTGRTYRPQARMSAQPHSRAATSEPPLPPRGFTRGTKSWQHHGALDCEGRDCERHKLEGVAADELRSMKSGITTRIAR